jgi:hypothetical protein
MHESRVLLFIAWAALALMLIGCSADERDGTLDAAALKPQLQALAGARILLGHQSVGRDILAGLESLAAEAGVPLRVLEIEGAPPDTAPGVFHSAIGRNGDPNSKCEIFARLLERPERPTYDLAAMKFCYVDLSENTELDPTQLLERYSMLVEQVRALRPDVRIVHVTLPLRSDPLEWKTPIKRFLGRSTYEDSANAFRNAYNDLLRERFAGEPIFDLAAVQSIGPDGTRSAFTGNGKTIYTLDAKYTYDGGHLNEHGRRRVAAEFVRSFADALSQG